MRILLADDHTMFRSGLRRIIVEQFPDATIDEASSCAECLMQCAERQYNLIILDISMQGQNSLTILPDINRRLPHTPILILSMHTDRQFVVQALRSGASAYLTKEHTAEELLQAISTTLSGRRYISSAIADNLVDYLQVGDCEQPHAALSARELEVFMQIARGCQISEIARTLSLSVKTISTYRTRLLEKMGMSSNAELTRYALRQGLVE